MPSSKTRIKIEQANIKIEQNLKDTNIELDKINQNIDEAEAQLISRKKDADINVLGDAGTLLATAALEIARVKSVQIKEDYDLELLRFNKGISELRLQELKPKEIKLRLNALRDGVRARTRDFPDSLKRKLDLMIDDRTNKAELAMIREVSSKANSERNAQLKRVVQTIEDRAQLDPTATIETAEKQLQDTAEILNMAPDVARQLAKNAHLKGLTILAKSRGDMDLLKRIADQTADTKLKANIRNYLIRERKVVARRAAKVLETAKDATDINAKIIKDVKPFEEILSAIDTRQDIHSGDLKTKKLELCNIAGNFGNFIANNAGGEIDKDISKTFQDAVLDKEFSDED